MGKNKKIAIIAIVAAIILGVGGFLIFKKVQEKMLSRPVSYTIPGVPYIGAHNQKFPYAGLDVDGSGVSEILEYWNPGKNNFLDVEKSLNGDANGNIQTKIARLDDYKKSFESYGYTFETANLQINELKKYINPDVRTPLLFYLPLDEDQPKGILYNPATLLIGINEPERKLIFHSYWLGNNFELSFDELSALWSAGRPDQRNKYIVVRPNDYNNIIKSVRSRKSDPYPARTTIMNNAQMMFKNYALSESAWRSGVDSAAKIYREKVMNDSNFGEWFPPFYQTRLFVDEARQNAKYKEYDSAIKNINQAIELDHDLNQPWKDWPGVDFAGNNLSFPGVGSESYRIFGDIYFAMGNFEKAKEGYSKALDINSQNMKAKSRLEEAEASLAAKK